MMITSSTSGSSASNIMLNFHLPPVLLYTINSVLVLKGLRGSNLMKNTSGSLVEERVSFLYSKNTERSIKPLCCWFYTLISYLKVSLKFTSSKPGNTIFRVSSIGFLALVLKW